MFTFYGGQDQEYVMYGDAELVHFIGMFIIVDIYTGTVTPIKYKHKCQQ